MKERIHKIGEVVSSEGAVSRVTEYYIGKHPQETWPYAKVTYQFKGWCGEPETIVSYSSVKPIEIVEVYEGERTKENE